MLNESHALSRYKANSGSEFMTFFKNDKLMMIRWVPQIQQFLR